LCLSLALTCGIQVQSLGLGLGLDKKVLFTSLQKNMTSCVFNNQSINQSKHIFIAPYVASESEAIKTS